LTDMVYVDAEVRIGGGEGLARCGQKRTRGRGVKNSPNFCGCPLWTGRS